jgi:hypothetical protein
MEMSERKNVLIKNHITRYVDTPFLGILTLEALVHVAVSKKDTLLRTKLELARVIWT